MSSNSRDVILDNDHLIFQCPHCGEYVLVYLRDLNCKIFRHAVFKNNYVNINPHTSREDCINLINKQQIFGCAKPFQIIQLPNNTFQVQQCNYV